MVRVIAVAWGLCSLAACGAPRTLNMSRPAAAAEYAPFLSPSTPTGAIQGQAFMRTRGGGVVLGAGAPVTIDPATTFAREWYEQTGLTVDWFWVAPRDSLFGAARRTAVVDAQGNFLVDSLPAGRYLVRTVVQWEAPTTGYGTSTQGGVVSELVEVIAGRTTRVIIQDTRSVYAR